MKNEILYLLLNNYADHEAVFLASAITCDKHGIKEILNTLTKSYPLH